MVFISQLPANTNLGPTVAGAPGARTAWRADRKPVYELAPVDVQREMKWEGVKQSIADAPGKAAVALDPILTPLIEATGLDHGPLGVLAKALGIPFSLFIVILLFVAYAMLRQYGLVPPIKKVVS